MQLPLLASLAAACALLGCAAHAGSGSAPLQPQAARSAAPADSELLQRLRALESASTCSASADCKALPVGARLCGGPSAWLAVSAAHMAEAAPLAERYTALRKAANEAAQEEGRAGTCRVVPQPAIGCIGGYCRALPVGPSGRAD